MPERYSKKEVGVQLVLDKTVLSRKYSDDMKSANVNVKKEFRFKKAIIVDRKVQSIIVVGNNNKEVQIYADFFIDSSVNGVLCTYEGVEDIDYFLGEDPYERYHERLMAGVISDSRIMNEPSIYFEVSKISTSRGPTTTEFPKIDEDKEYIYRLW